MSKSHAINFASHVFLRECRMDFTYIWSLVILCTFLFGGVLVFDFCLFFAGWGVLLGRHPWPVEVPSLGVQLEL